jgi:hypothetical protein
MRLGTSNFHAGRLAGGFGVILAGAMLTGCMSSDKRPNSTSQQKLAKANTNTSSQSNTNNSSATGGNANVAANQNSSNQIPAASTPGLNTTNNNTANGTPGIAPLGKPTGMSAGSTYNPIPNNNMNAPPQFGGGLQQTGAALPNANGLQPIATSVNSTNRGNAPIQNLTGPANGPAGLPPLDAVPSSNPNTSQRPAPPAVSMQWSDRTLNFPTGAPLSPTPTVNPGPMNLAPVNPAPINPLPMNGNPTGPIAPLPTGGN